MTSRDEDERQLETLAQEIGKRTPGLNTIQILCPNHRAAEQFVWYTLSANLGLYHDAVELFLHIDRKTGIARQTLAFTEYTASSFWQAVLPKRGPPELHGPLSFEQKEFGEVRTMGAQPPLDERLDGWLRSLAHFYPCGHTFWLTAQHRIHDRPDPVVSSIFLLFDDEVPQSAHESIARLAREHLFDQVIRCYEARVVEQHRILEDSLLKYLRDDPKDVTLCDETRRKLRALRPILIGRMPFFIEGERGVGKLNAARYLHRIIGQANRTLDPSTPLDELTIVDSYFLRHGAERLQRKLDEIGLWRSDKFVLGYTGTVVFDDIHQASAEAQHLMYRLVESRLSAQFDPSIKAPARGPWLIFTISPNVAKAVQQNALIPELEMLGGSFSCKLPTIQQRLGSCATEGEKRALFRAIVDYFVERARQVVPGAPAAALSDDELTKMMREEWPTNYTGLRHDVLHRVLMSMEGGSS